MPQVLLWVCFAVGLVAILSRFLPGSKETSAADPVAEPNHLLHWLGYLTPLLGFLLTLPTGGPFGKGQQFGVGFLLGGVAALLAWLCLRDRKTATGIALTATSGVALAAVAVALLFLPASRFDTLLGVAIGWFCPTVALFLALPAVERTGPIGQRMAAGVGLAVTLSVGTALNLYRDPLTSQFPRLSWSALFLTFAAVGTLLNAGTARFPQRNRLLALAVLVLGAGFGLFQLDGKLLQENRLTLIGVGGLLLLPVVLAVLKEVGRRETTMASLLPMVLLTTGFLAAVQTLQGAGAALLVLAGWLALPALLPFLGDEDDRPEKPSFLLLNVLLFGTLLLLWRFFVTRWAGDLRGVNLTDQYALFGLILGAALPSLLALVPTRWPGGKDSAAGIGMTVLLLTAFLTLAIPTVALLLFGPKSAVALLIGLALGIGFRPMPGGSPLAALLAVGVALALCQWTGHALPDEAWTRAEKIRALIVLMAALVPLAILSDRLAALFGKAEEK